MSEQNERLLKNLEHLVKAIGAQTQAIQSLAESNVMLVQAMAEVDAEEAGDIGQYLDGTPMQRSGAG